MDFFNQIKNLDDEQLKELISLKIDEQTYKASVNQKRFIGIDCGINPEYSLTEETEKDNKAMWFGYIPKDVKIIYSFTQNSKGYTINNGGYYYMDDSVVYEFALYARDKKANNYLEFLDIIWSFVDQYFNNLMIPLNSRSEMLSPLLRDENWYFEPLIEHTIKTFKGRNNAMCSEYTAIVQNILTVFGYQSMYFVGSVQCDFAAGPHAFNIALIEGHPLLLDYTLPVPTYDLNNNLVATSPYLGIIRNFSVDKLITSTKDDDPLDFPEYDFYLLNGKEQYHELNTRRYYAIGNVTFFEKHPNYQKKSKGLQTHFL